MRKTALLVVLAAVMLLGIAGAAFADSVDYPGANLPPWTATNGSDPVEVKATVNPKITLTVQTPDGSQSVDFLTVDPDTRTGGKTVNLFVDSNKQFDLSVSEDVAAFAAADITLNRTLTDTPNNAKGKDVAFTDDYEIVTTWDTEPGAYTAAVTYTVVQD